jgi:hypothetical protein
MEDQNKQLANVHAEAPRPEYSVTDMENPNSVVNLIKNTPTIHRAVLRLIDEAPELLSIEESVMKAEIHPTVTLLRIRVGFWTEYENAISRGAQIKGSQIYAGICTENYFKDKILTDNRKLAFLLCPPTDYVVQVKEALQAGMETMRQILGAKVIDDEGFLIPKAAEAVIKVVAMLDQRVKGAIVQRVDQRTVNMNLNKEMGAKDVLPSNMDELQALLDKTKQALVSHPVRTAPAQLDRAHEDLVKHELIDVSPAGSASGAYKSGN